MKKNKNIWLSAFIAFVISLGAFTSCVEDIQLKSLPYLFRPINFNVSLYKTVATISWAKVDSAKAYQLQISTDSLYKSIVIDTTLTQLTFSKELAGETSFYARIKTIANDTTKNSKYNSTLTFKTPKENLFLGFGTKNNTGNLYSAYMNNAKTLDIKWQPAANTTHLILTSADGNIRDSVSLLPDDITAGEKLVSALNNSTWKIQIFNGKILRGTTYGLIEGDVILNDGDNLQTALAAATPGQIILLAGKGNYSIGSSTFKFGSNIKLRGLSPVNRPTICMTGASATATMFNLLPASIDSLVFENLNFTGYNDNLATSAKIKYFFYSGGVVAGATASTIKDMKFRNCAIHDVDVTFRLASTTWHITNLTFNGCLINNTGNGYAIVNINKTTDYIDNITFANSTISQTTYPLISISQSAATTMNSVVVSNCTFNQTTLDTPTPAARALFTFDFMNITNGISISKCIFGSSGPNSAGLKATNATTAPTVNITGCYYTSDFVDETLIATVPYPIKYKMAAYSGTSLTLWNGPTTGDFSLKDTNFAGKTSSGDLRW